MPLQDPRERALLLCRGRPEVLWTAGERTPGLRASLAGTGEQTTHEGARDVGRAVEVLCCSEGSRCSQCAWVSEARRGAYRQSRKDRSGENSVDMVSWWLRAQVCGGERTSSFLTTAQLSCSGW